MVKKAVRTDLRTHWVQFQHNFGIAKENKVEKPKLFHRVHVVCTLFNAFQRCFLCHFNAISVPFLFPLGSVDINVNSCINSYA